MNISLQAAAVQAGVVPSHRPWDCIGPFTQYEARPQPGFGCFAFRIGNYQGVRARREQSWSIFKNGTCVEFCLSDETAARAFITSQLKLN